MTSLLNLEDKLEKYLQGVFTNSYVSSRWGLISVWVTNRHNADEINSELLLRFLQTDFPELSLDQICKLHEFFSIATDYDRDVGQIVISYRFNVVAMELYLEGLK